MRTCRGRSTKRSSHGARAGLRARATARRRAPTASDQVDDLLGGRVAEHAHGQRAAVGRHARRGGRPRARSVRTARTRAARRAAATSGRACSAVTRRGLGANTKPTAQAPSSTARATSSGRVRPQTLTKGLFARALAHVLSPRVDEHRHHRHEQQHEHHTNQARLRNGICSKLVPNRPDDERQRHEHGRHDGQLLHHRGSGGWKRSKGADPVPRTGCRGRCRATR